MEQIKLNFLEGLTERLEDICQQGKPNGIETTVRRMNELQNYTDSMIRDFKLLVSEDKNLSLERKEKLNTTYSTEANAILSGIYKKYFNEPLG